MGLNADAFGLIKSLTADWPAEPEDRQLNRILVMLGRWRQHRLLSVWLERQGVTIWGGPFKGMEYVSQATEGALLPRLIGTYESELHPHLARLADEGLDCVIDVGCAEGYYAVGLARMMPSVTVHARDINEKALAACRELAGRNGVADRVITGGEFKPQDFEAFAGRRALVIVDAEGAEVDILQPELSPALAGMNLIVETHNIYRAQARQTLMARFAPTHDIELVVQRPKTFEAPAWFNDVSHLDQLLAVWEWRVAPTPWLVMRPKTGT